MIMMKGNHMFAVYAWQAWTLMLFAHTRCYRMSLPTDMALKALIEAEINVLKVRIKVKRNKGVGKHIGRLPRMKYGKLLSQAEAIVLARLARGGISSASSSSIDALQSPASSPPSSSRVVGEVFSCRWCFSSVQKRG